MKKTVQFIISIIAVIGITGCAHAPGLGSDGSSKPAGAEYAEAGYYSSKWFDSLKGDVMVWDEVREITLDEFPGVTFRWHPEKLEAVTDNEIVSLYTGMPIWSVYFCDLTGDGKPELCSTISIGSGIIDNRIIVYDYAERVSYELSDRMNYDYLLNMQEGKLIVEKRKYMREELISTGELVLMDGTIQMQSENFD